MLERQRQTSKSTNANAKKKVAAGSDFSSTRGSEERTSVPATGRGQKRGRDFEIEKVRMHNFSFTAPRALYYHPGSGICGAFFGLDGTNDSPHQALDGSDDDNDTKSAFPAGRNGPSKKTQSVGGKPQSAGRDGPSMKTRSAGRKSTSAGRDGPKTNTTSVANIEAKSTKSAGRDETKANTSSTATVLAKSGTSAGRNKSSTLSAGRDESPRKLPSADIIATKPASNMDHAVSPGSERPKQAASNVGRVNSNAIGGQSLSSANDSQAIIERVSSDSSTLSTAPGSPEIEAERSAVNFIPSGSTLPEKANISPDIKLDPLGAAINPSITDLLPGLATENAANESSSGAPANHGSTSATPAPPEAVCPVPKKRKAQDISKAQSAPSAAPKKTKPAPVTQRSQRARRATNRWQQSTGDGNPENDEEDFVRPTKVRKPVYYDRVRDGVDSRGRRLKYAFEAENPSEPPVEKEKKDRRPLPPSQMDRITYTEPASMAKRAFFKEHNEKKMYMIAGIPSEDGPPSHIKRKRSWYAANNKGAVPSLEYASSRKNKRQRLSLEGVKSEKPSTETEKPSAETEEPSAETEEPSVETEELNTETEDPGQDTALSKGPSPQESPVITSTSAIPHVIEDNSPEHEADIEPSSQEEAFHSRPEVRIPITDQLKSILVDDWENVTKNLTLVPLPSKWPVNKIMDLYHDEEKDKRRPGSAEADLLEEVVQGVKEYFEKCLGRILLYRFEREQYFEVRKKWEAGVGPEWEGKGVNDVYGPEHLCRLFGMSCNPFPSSSYLPYFKHA